MTPVERRVLAEPLNADEAIAMQDIGAATQLACLLEVSAPKPGNVSPGRHFVDTRYEDFLASAAAIGAPMAGAGSRPLGETIRLSIDATVRWTRTNTNLGMVLLLAPLARARCLMRPDQLAAGTRGWREALNTVLERTTVDDAREVYRAIRLAAPGGLGRAESQDVAQDPEVSLLDAMRLAAHRDGIAREYATAFEVTFSTAVPALQRARADRLSWDDAIVETFLTLLAAEPDTHIVRRSGKALAAEVSDRARQVLAAGGVRSAAGRIAIVEMDRALRDDRHRANPGTTADITTAAVFVMLVGPGAQGSGLRGRGPETQAQGH